MTPADLMNAMRKQLKELTDSLKVTMQSMTTALTSASAGMVGLTAAASPVAFNTFTRSGQLLATVVGQSLIPAMMQASFRLQDAARWVRSLSDDTRKAIGSWSGYGVAALAATLVVGKIGGMVASLLPVLGALKAAMVFTVTNPFGLVVAGLAAVAVASPQAFAPLLEAGRSLLPVLSALGTALQPLVGAFTGFATGVVTVVSQAIRVFAVGLQTLTGLLPRTASGIILVGAAFVTAFGPWAAGGAIALSVGLGIINMLGRFGPPLAALAGGVLAVAAAWKYFGLALTASPIGVMVFAIGAVVTALGAMGGAFGRVGEQVRTAHEAIAQLRAELERLGEGGKVKAVHDLGLSPEQEKLLQAAKTPEEQKKVLGDIHAQEKKKLEGMSPEDLKKQQDIVRQVLAEAPHLEDRSLYDKIEGFGDSAELQGAAAREGTIAKRLKGAGYSDEIAQKISRGFGDQSSLLSLRKDGDVPLGQKNLSAADIEKMTAFIRKPAIEQEVKVKGLENAIQQGGFDARGKAPQTRLEQLQALQSKYGMSLNKEMMPQRLDVGNVRAMFQNAGIGKDTLEAEILKDIREGDRKAYGEMIKELTEIKKKL